MIEVEIAPPPMIARVTELENSAVTAQELNEALAPIWREIDRVLAQLGLHRSS